MKFISPKFLATILAIALTPKPSPLTANATMATKEIRQGDWKLVGMGKKSQLLTWQTTSANAKT